jgi:hypothetical protein
MTTSSPIAGERRASITVLVGLERLGDSMPDIAVIIIVPRRPIQH